MKTIVRNLSFIAFIILIAISCKKEIPLVPATGIKLSQTSLFLNVGSLDTLNAIIDPSNATNQDVKWLSSDSTIVRVKSNGIISGVAPGVATITVTSTDGRYSASCIIKSIKWTIYTTNNGLADNQVRCIAIDSLGYLWFGGSSVSRFGDSGWATYLKNIGAGAIAVDANNNKWFGTYGFGVYKYDDTNWTLYDTSNCGLRDNSINTNAIDIDLQGSIWVGTSSRVTWRGTGVSMFDGTNWKTYSSSDGLNYNNVLFIKTDAQGNKWFASKGISKFNGTNWTSYTSSNTNNELVDNANSIAIDAKNNKWFGTSLGLLKFDGINWTTYTTSNSGIVSNAINTITIDKHGNIWICTRGGVSKYDGTTWTNYDHTNGLSSYVILSIAIDSHGNKWFGTTDGVFELQD